MKRFILDCSVSAAWCFADERNPYVDDVLESFADGYQALVPSIWVLETLNVLSVAERRSRMAEAEAAHLFELYCSLPILLDTRRQSVAACRSILPLGRRHALSSYDAAYLDIALRNGIPLATQDKSLRQACIKSGVAIFRLDQD